MLERETEPSRAFSTEAIKNKALLERSLKITSGRACLRNLKSKGLVKSKRAGIDTDAAAKIYTAWHLSAQGRTALASAGLSLR